MVSKLDQLRALREAKDHHKFRNVVTKEVDAMAFANSLNLDGLKIKGKPSKSVGDGVALTSIKHPKGRPLNKDRPKSLAALQPWKAEGMSRRTWFRRKRRAEGKA